MLFPITAGNPTSKITSYHYITMPIQVYTDLCLIVDHFNTEVSGCGLVERVEHRYKGNLKSDPDIVEIEFKIIKIFLPEKQTNTRSSTEIDEEEINKIQCKLVEDGINTELFRLHWHSHADMDTFHSGTDEDNYDTLSGGDFLVSLVLNREHKFLGRVDYFKPVRVMLSNLDVKIELNIEEVISEEINESIKGLDKFEKEQNSRCTVITYNGNKNNNLESSEVEKNSLMNDIEIARQLQVPIKDAMRYRGCMQINCGTCKEAEVCQEYLYHIDKLSMWQQGG